jgi:hypothetical protein
MSIKASGAGGAPLSFSVRVQGHGSRFCFNKAGDHATNNVFFTIKPSGICQRCWSKKEVRRSHGYCKDFCSDPRELEVGLRRELFGVRELPFGLGPDSQAEGEKTQRFSSSRTPRRSAATSSSSKVTDAAEWIAAAVRNTQEQSVSVPTIRRREGAASPTFATYGGASRGVPPVLS